MQLTWQVLEDRFVRLEPLAEARRDELRAACADDQEIWERLYPNSFLGEHFDVQWARLTREAEAGRILPFAVVVGGVCRGMTSYLAPDAINRSVEIGGTYYAPEQRGGPTNPAAKRLLLAHAFGCGADRVQLKVDALNARSRAAVLKLGATQEGVLRHERIVWTGRVRDTVVFSILGEEWPKVKAGLDARLAD